MKKRLIFLSLIVILLLGMTPAGTAVAQSETGYKAGVYLTSDPDDTALDTQAVAFDVSTKTVVAWVVVEGVGGAPEKDFKAQIEFIAPDGKEYPGEWYQTGGTVTALNENITENSMARRLIRVAGEKAADLPGEWTVNAYIDGDLFTVEKFTLTGGKQGPSSQNVTASDDAWQSLEDKGYTVLDVGNDQFDDGTPFAYVTMNMASSDLYSSEVSQQIFDASSALSAGYPDVKIYLLDLIYTERYDVLIFVTAADWQTYQRLYNWDKFARSLVVAVWDSQTGQALEAGAETKNFIDKQFGPGAPQEPGTQPPSRKTGGGRVGAIEISTSVLQLPADGKSTAEVNVVAYDRNSKPMPDAEVKFTVSGAGGRIRPSATTTDSEGAAAATYTVGTKAGKVTIVATSGKQSASAVITVGEKGKAQPADDAASQVTALLSGQGYTVNGAGVMTDKSGKDTGAVMVDMDMASSQIDQDVLLQVIYGWFALAKSYPDAQYLVTLLRYQNYGLFWSVTSQDFVAFVNEKIDGETFGKQMLDNLVIVDMTTGEQVQPNDFINKRF